MQLKLKQQLTEHFTPLKFLQEWQLSIPQRAVIKKNVKVVTVTQNEISEVKIELEPETENNLQKQLDDQKKIELYGIYFDTDKAIIKKKSEKTLKALLELIKNNPNIKFEIGGHTDSQGDDNYNLELSEKRAKAVLDWLKSNNLNIRYLTSKGYGETNPVANNNTEIGRALNRRVELIVLPN